MHSESVCAEDGVGAASAAMASDLLAGPPGQSPLAKRIRRISIGLCAWNEAKRLPKTIESLSRQDCFLDASSPIKSIEIVIAANSCTDNTVEVAEACLASVIGRAVPGRVTFKVAHTDVKGKANAWNMFVHELSSRDADYLISMDSDIEFLSPDVITRLVESLERDPVAEIARPVCRKSTELRRTRSLSDRIALAASRQQQAAKWYVSLPGAIYCARAAAIRRVWQPLGMLGDDGHLRDMIVTENWRCPYDRKDAKVILADDVAIAFEAHTGLRDILWHQVRARIGLANRTIFHRYLDTAVGDEDASQLAARLNVEDPQWYARIIQQGVDKRSWWVMPWSPFALKRVRELGRQSLGRRLRAAPVALMGDLSDLVADLRANRAFRQGRALSVW